MNYRQSVSTMVMIAALAPALPSHAAGSAVLPDPQKVYSETEAIQIGWPMMAGPYGNYQPLRTKIPIVDDLAEVRQVWKTKGLRLGNCKSGTGMDGRIEQTFGPEATLTPGSWASVIVADGKAFAASFRPVGEFVEVENADGKGKTTRYKVRMDAEDVVVAVDFRTGKTLWMATEPGGVLWGAAYEFTGAVTGQRTTK